MWILSGYNSAQRIHTQTVCIKFTLMATPEDRKCNFILSLCSGWDYWRSEELWDQGTPVSGLCVVLSIYNLFLLEQYVSLLHPFCYFNHHCADKFLKVLTSPRPGVRFTAVPKAFLSSSDRKLAKELAPGSEPGLAFGTVCRLSILPPSAPESCWQLWKQRPSQLRL